ncbi:MAG: Ig-like domain-containing protein [Anaerolineae bacterium]|nr:Ig-like domain-containing protein [Anaerolineae bacterium]
MNRKLGLVVCLVVALAMPLQAAVSAQEAAFPPRVVTHLPLGGEELPLDGAVDIFFDQPMDKRSVEGAFMVTPQVEGDFTWLDDTAVRFAPTAALERGRQYHVVIADTAAAENGLTLIEPYAFTLQTVGFLAVSQVLPADGAEGVEADSVITVVFNRPVVPLVIAEEMDDLPDPLAIDPPTDGAGAWLNTSIYQFRPAEPLIGGMTYTVTVAAGLEDTIGGVLEAPYTWTFTTLPPMILETSPRDGASNVALEPSISVTFNQPMDRPSTEAAFSLVNAERVQRVPGAFAWEANDTQLTFTPEGRLDLSTTYTVRVEGSALAASGEAPLAAGLQWSFITAPPPSIIDTDPRDGAQGIRPGSGISIYFASPMDEATLEDRVQIDPEPDQVNYYYNTYDNRLMVSFSHAPATAYTVTIEAGMADVYGNVIEQGMQVRFSTGDYDPYAYVQMPDRVGMLSAAAADTQLFTTYRNVSSLDLSLSTVRQAEFISLIGRDSWELWDTYAPTAEQLVRAWSVPVEPERNTRHFYLAKLASEEGGALEPGLYYLQLSAPETVARDYIPSRQLLILATVNLTLKVSTDRAFVWVTDLERGAPVANVPVTLYDENGRELLSGNTNADGVLEGAIPSLPDLYEPVYAVVDTGSEFGLSTNYWTNGIDPWSFDLNGDYYPVNETVYLYTDRAVYRPGQPVYFRGVVRDRDDVTYTMPTTARRIPVHIEDTRGETIYREELELSEFGTFSGAFTLADEAELGYYNLVSEYGGRTRTLGFGVAEYRLPEFTVSVLPDRKEVVQGDTITVEMDSAFYFGGPVSDAQVSWVVLGEDYSFYYTGRGRWDFVDFNEDEGRYRLGYGYSEEIASGEGMTDARGHFTVEVPADLGDKTQSQRYTIEFTVTDISGQAVSNRDTVIVHQGEVYVGLRPAQYVGTAEEEMAVNLITVDWASEPAPDQTVTLTAFERRWSSVLEEDENGNTAWTWQVEEIEVASGEVTTDDEGAGVFTFTPPRGGVYKVVAVTRDALGNAVRSSTFMWVAGPGYVPWRQENNYRIDLIPDADTYDVGDEAEILITSPFQGAVTALITVERAGVLQYDVVALETNSHIYRLPITPAHAPNIYVSVLLVKGVDEDNPVAAFRMGEVLLTVSTAQKQVNVELTPSTDVAGPGDTVTYEVVTTDFEGRPVQAEVGLALTDQAALDIAPPNSGPILAHFYGQQGLSVRTSVLLTMSVDRLTQETLETVKGGGGGGGEGAFFDVRQEFVDTPYWNAHVVTDEDGRAAVDVTLPDNLTTWNMDARAVTADTLVGQNTVDIVATKPLLVRPVTPRFLVVGDEVILGAVVNNNTGEDLEVEVGLAEVEGLDVTDDLTQTITLEAGARGRVNWAATVQDVSAVTLIFTAQGGDYRDASRPTLGQGEDQAIPVYRYEAPETVGTGGTLREGGATTEAVALPRTMDVTRGELTVRLDPSLAAATVDGLDYLTNFTYQCTEQTVSRFLPNLMTYRALETLGLANARLEAELRTQVNWALQRLYAQQHVDGGWGWWVNDPSNPTVTAYALWGLIEARDAGFAVSGQTVNDAIAYLRENLMAISINSRTYVMNRQAFSLYVLARAGAGDIARTVVLYDLRERLSLYARAYLAMTFSMIDGTDRSRVDVLLSDLSNAAILSATGAHWEEGYNDWWNWSTNTRTTAIVLSTLARLDPQNPLAPNAVRWLMVAREGDRWETTQETAWAVMALTDWMLVTGELEADYTFNATLNGVELGAGVASPETVRETTTLRVEVADLLAQEINRLTIARDSGPGVLYYTSHLRVFLPVEDIASLNRGVILDRRYHARRRPGDAGDGRASGT